MKRHLQPEIQLHATQNISKQERNNYCVIELVTKLCIGESFIREKEKCCLEVHQFRRKEEMFHLDIVW